MEKYLECLGCEAIDQATKFKGTVTSVSFEVSGCVMVFIQPAVNEKNEVPEGRWYDHKRLSVSDRVLEQPTFDNVPGGRCNLPPIPVR